MNTTWAKAVPFAGRDAVKSATRGETKIITRRRKAQTTIEAHQVLILKNARKPVQTWCAECAELVVMISLEEAVRLTGAISRTVHRWIEAGETHFAETAEGLLLLGPASLSARIPGLNFFSAS